VREIREHHGNRGLLVDVHGQGRKSETIFRGTRAGVTVDALLKRSGAQAVQGPKSLIGQLAAMGYGVNPPVGAPLLEEDAKLDGGHTVAAYGSQHRLGIDAIQLEFGSTYRDRDHVKRTASDLAEAIIAFMKANGYLQ